MKILFITNVPSPYRVDFFNELGKSADLTVCYERESLAHRDKKWKGDRVEFFKEVYLKTRKLPNGQVIGFEIIDHIKSKQYDHIIFSGYSTPTVMLAIAYCRLKKIAYYTETDGGFNKKDKFPKSILKKFLILKAAGHFTTCKEHIDYLKSLGVPEGKIYRYPFTSLKSEDILAKLPSYEEKHALREKLGMTEAKIVLSVGRFSYDRGYGKGFDTLVNCAAAMDKNIGFYIVGDQPTEEFLSMKEELGAKNVHFIGFKNKTKLKDFYKAADISVLMTRGDVWGLVINEAMANGLPVITTDRCIAGLELVRNGENGYIVHVGDSETLAEKINAVLENENIEQMAQNSLETIKGYTIEKMADSHLRIFTKQ